MIRRIALAVCLFALTSVADGQGAAIAPPPPSAPIVGDDIETLAAIVRAKEFKMDEFETQEEFVNRIIKLGRSTIITGTDRPLANAFFVVSDPKRGFEYIPEDRGFVYRMSKFAGNQILRNYKDQIRSLVFVKPSTLRGWMDLTLLGEFFIPMPPEKARLVKNDLALGIYGMPVETQEDRYIGKELHIIPVLFVAVNMKTNEVYEQALTTAFSK